MADNDNNNDGKKQIFGILSTVVGGVSLVPFLGILSPIGLVLGVVGLFKDSKNLMSIIGTVVSVIGIATSPILWGVVGCTFGHCENIAKNTVDSSGYHSSSSIHLSTPNAPVAPNFNPTPMSPNSVPVNSNPAVNR